MDYNDYRLPDDPQEDLPEPREENFDKTYVVKRASKGNSLGLPPMVRLSDDEWSKVEHLIGQMLERAIEERSGLISKLAEYEEAIQGIPEAGRKGPWDGACKLRDQLTGAHCRIIEATINRTLGIDRPFIAVVKGTQDNKGNERKLTGIANEAASQFKYIEVLGKITKAAVRAGTAIIIPDWERKVKVSKDVKTYYEVSAYREDYPNAEAAGLTKSEYNLQIVAVKRDIKEQGFHECLFEFDERVINQPKVLVVRPEKFVMFPMSSPDTDLAQLVGYEVRKTYNDLLLMERSGQILHVDKLAKMTTLAVEPTFDEARTIKLENKGISSESESLSIHDKIFTVYKLTVRLDIYQDGLARDYEVLYAYEGTGHLRCMLRLAPYAIHCNERNTIIANVLPEEDTVFGTPMPELLENPQKALDVMLRQLIDSNSIANVPIFKGHANDKEFIESAKEKGRIFPGRTFWLKQPQVFEAFRADRIDADAYLRMMQHVAQQSETNTGGSRSLAGQNLPDDPQSPGVKTSMLIQQSSFMINEYIKNLRGPMAQMIRLVIKLYRQYLADKEEMVITVENSSRQYEEVTITRDDIKFLEELTNFDLKNQQVEDGDAVRMQQARFDMELLLAVPMIAQNPTAVRALIMNYLNSHPRISEREIELIVPPMEQIQQQMQEVAQETLAQERAQQGQQQIVEQAQGQADQTTEQSQQEMQNQMGQLGGMIDEARGG